MTSVVAPIELAGRPTEIADRFGGAAVAVSDSVLDRLAEAAPTTTDVTTTVEAGRDWWPLAMHWALAGEVPRRAAAVCRPIDAEQVAAVVRICGEERIPLTAAGGRSGVCAASVPAFGGVVLDLTGLSGVVGFDDASGVVEVLAGTFGPELEAELATHGRSVGHFPQSFEISTVGGWVACRGAGQYSTRYGKIDEMVAALEVVLADGTTIRTGGAPAAATGPDLTRLFVGAEGTLGIVTRVWLRTHPSPPTEQRAAFSFGSFGEGIDACRDILRRGATPAVLRLYDGVESARGHGGNGSQCMLLVLDEGDPALVAATMGIVAEECAAAEPAPVDLVGSWLEHRNDTTALQALTRKGFVVDTMEIAARWGRLTDIATSVTAAMTAVEHTRVVSCHLSHSYPDGACLYFTFAATPPAEEIESTYVALWDAGQRAVLAAGGNLSHHHGVGVNRARFMAEALVGGEHVLQAIKDAVDPAGILNPGKLGLRHPFGDVVVWPR